MCPSVPQSQESGSAGPRPSGTQTQRPGQDASRWVPRHHGQVRITPATYPKIERPRVCGTMGNTSLIASQVLAPSSEIPRPLWRVFSVCSETGGGCQPGDQGSLREQNSLFHTLTCSLCGGGGATDRAQHRPLTV